MVTEVIEECAEGGKIRIPDLRTLPWVIEVSSTEEVTISILLELDRGEKHTLQMAKAMDADRIIIDEKIGRDVAEYIGLEVTGTLGVLLKAKQNGWINSFTSSANSMMECGIRYHDKLIKRLAKIVGEA